MTLLIFIFAEVTSSVIEVLLVVEIAIVENKIHSTSTSYWKDNTANIMMIIARSFLGFEGFLG